MEDLKQAVAFIKFLAGSVIGILWCFLDLLGRQGRLASLVIYIILSYILKKRVEKFSENNSWVYTQGFFHYFLSFAFFRTFTFTLLHV